MAATEHRPITAATGPEDGIAEVQELEASRLRLRQRWELASVLNFLKVFEPVLKSKLKNSAEEIEMGLIEPNNLLFQLHIMLLQGIPPVSKTLNGSDAWVAALSKKLSSWWPWVAEGEFPLIVAKGEEMIRYRELDPIVRLMILKALCEIRADQDDIVSFINDEIKSGTELSAFRKNSIGTDGKGTSYWYDGSTVIGHRLYKEVNTSHSMSKVKRNKDVPIVNSQWETLATNLEEFSRVVDAFTSSKSTLEVAVGKAVETEAIPALIKLQKKREKELKQLERQQRLLTGFRTSGITRLCRSKRPITYTFDDYDKAINEAIRQTKKRKINEDNKHARNVIAPNDASDPDLKARKRKLTETDTDNTDTETASDKIEGGDAEDTSSEEDYSNENEDYDTDKENKNPSNKDQAKLRPKKQDWPKGSRRSKGVADIAPSPIPDIKKLGAKNRPKHITALESAILLDSEGEGIPS